jgi:tryptophan synthase alpha chain
MLRLGAHVTALDISPGQLELLRARVPDIEAVVGDITDLSRFADDAFDVTVCFGGPLSYVVDRAEHAIAELARVTRPGGHVLVSVMGLAGAVIHYAPILVELARRDGPARSLELARTGVLPEADGYGHLAMRMYLWEELEELLAPHGEVVEGVAAGVLPHVEAEEPEIRALLEEFEEKLAYDPELAHAAVEGGADIVELGFPFSDPLAEGPVIRRASERALARGMRTHACLDVLARTRELLPGTPLVPMTYAAILEAYGYERFAAEARERGASSFILVDLPVEEHPELRRIQLVAPTSTEERIRAAAEATDGWLYLVSVTGTTGARTELSPALPPFVQRVRDASDVPLYVGFGISTPELARAAGELADGVVVGSRAVQVAEDGPEALRDFVASLRAALDS